MGDLVYIPAWENSARRTAQNRRHRIQQQYPTSIHCPNTIRSRFPVETLPHCITFQLFWERRRQSLHVSFSIIFKLCHEWQGASYKLDIIFQGRDSSKLVGSKERERRSIGIPGTKILEEQSDLWRTDILLDGWKLLNVWKAEWIQIHIVKDSDDSEFQGGDLVRFQ